MQTIEKINRARRRDKEVLVLQEAHKRNQITRLMPFRTFLTKRNKLGLGKNTPVAKAISEEIIGNFENEEISDAIYCYMSSNSDAADKQIVTNELATKIIAMAQSSDVILVAVSVSQEVAG